MVWSSVCQIEKKVFEIPHIVPGMVNDKDLDEILPLFPKKSHYYFCKPNSTRLRSKLFYNKKASDYQLNK
jgi:dihydrofolate synthase/folylpolyglutamate synthase